MRVNIYLDLRFGLLGVKQLVQDLSGPSPLVKIFTRMIMTSNLKKQMTASAWKGCQRGSDQTTPPVTCGSKTEKITACDQGKQNLNMGGYGMNFLDFW